MGHTTTEPEQEWARELFDRARAARGETAWTADAAAVKAAGIRRRRVRGFGMIGGAVSVATAAALVAVGLTGVAGRSDGQAGGSLTGPTGNGWQGRPLALVFEYVSIPEVEGTTPNPLVVPRDFAWDVANTLGTVDPGLGHLTPVNTGQPAAEVVPNQDPRVRQITAIVAQTNWRPSGDAPDHAVASVSIRYAVTDSELHPAPPGASGAAGAAFPCGFVAGGVTSPITPEIAVTWSDCVGHPLADGSRIDTSTGADADGKTFFAVRRSPHGGGLTITVQEHTAGSAASTPFSADLLVTALSGVPASEAPSRPAAGGSAATTGGSAAAVTGPAATAIGPAAARPAGVPHPMTDLVQPADFGGSSRWTRPTTA